VQLNTIHCCSVGAYLAQSIFCVNSFQFGNCLRNQNAHSWVAHLVGTQRGWGLGLGSSCDSMPHVMNAHTDERIPCGTMYGPSVSINNRSSGITSLTSPRRVWLLQLVTTPVTPMNALGNSSRIVRAIHSLSLKQWICNAHAHRSLCQQCKKQARRQSVPVCIHVHANHAAYAHARCRWFPSRPFVNVQLLAFRSRPLHEFAG
jgi:hypothetical protein